MAWQSQHLILYTAPCLSLGSSLSLTLVSGLEAILLLMLSLTGSDRSLWRDRTASTLDTIVSVGIRLGVTECFSP